MPAVLPEGSRRGLQFPAVESPDNDSAFSSDNGSLPGEGGTYFQSNGNQQQLIYQTGNPVRQRQLYVQIFSGDGSTVSLSVDESMTVGDVLSILVEKNHVQHDPQWGIVEQIPELYMERCFEDHECLLENLLRWRKDSQNKILFLSRPEKYDLFRRPERYLVTSPSYESESNSRTKTGCSGMAAAKEPPVLNNMPSVWDQFSRQSLLQEFFSRSSEDYYPEIEGILWMKSEGKKSWKKNFFALRADGIYQRGGKLLASLSDHQVYRGIGWKKKYKAPNDFGFALKVPEVQTKDESKRVKYLCADSESILLKWLTGVRIVKNRNALLENYQNQLAEMTTGHCIARENRVVIAIDKDEQRQRNVYDNSRLHSAQDVYSPSSTTSSSISSDRDLLMTACPSENVSNKSSESLSSSGCVSETSSISENGGFESDYPDGGTIRRKPSQKCSSTVSSPGINDDLPTPTVGSDDEEFALPPPPMPEISYGSRLGEEVSAAGCSSLPLPPPPPCLSMEAHKEPPVYHRRNEPHGIGVREELYPCGVVRALFPNRASASTQMDLLKRLPNQIPPPQPEIQIHRKKKISFNEMVQNIDTETSESVLTPLKFHDEYDLGFKIPSASVRNPNPGKLFGEDHLIKGTPPREFLNELQRVMYKKWTLSQKIFPFVGKDSGCEGDSGGFEDIPCRGEGSSNYNESAVSQWILQSLKHCQINEKVLNEELPPPPPSLLKDSTSDRKPGIMPPRSVPNCFPPRPEDRPFLLCQIRADNPQRPPNYESYHQYGARAGYPVNKTNGFPPQIPIDHKIRPSPPRRNDATSLSMMNSYLSQR